MSLYSIFLFSVLLFATITSAANIPPGSSLYASNPNRTWSSPNATFFLGFKQVGRAFYTLSISYNGGVPIWTASGPSAAIVDSLGALHFLRNGTLQLVNGSGAIVWDSNTANLGVTSASLNENGNLVLQNDTASVWSSFENPTDTIVANQNFTSKQVLRSGDYLFHFLRSGNMRLTWNGSIVYWNQGLNSNASARITSPTLVLQPVGILSISDVTLTRRHMVAYANDYAEGSDVLRFLRLGGDGNLRMYSSKRGSGTITMTWAALADQCQVYGYCGNMGICSYNDSNLNPVCGCPSEDFEPVDVNDKRKGCKRKVEIENCPGNATMMKLDHAKFSTHHPEQSFQVFFLGITACRMNCLVSRSCFASTSLSDGTGECYLKTSGFVSGYQNPALPSTSYVKVCAPLQS